jgi:hypothetical protein
MREALDKLGAQIKKKEKRKRLQPAGGGRTVRAKLCWAEQWIGGVRIAASPETAIGMLDTRAAGAGKRWALAQIAHVA